MTIVASSSTSDEERMADVDFDLHGFVGVRLHEPTPGDVATITRQIGPLQSPLHREPDITVRFVDRILDDRPLTYCGWLDAGFSDDAFYLLRGREGVAARVHLPLEDVGGRCDIVCERRAGFVPHLLAIINFAALSNGVLPLHASAFTYHGIGVLATGWAKGGKTETLLAFAARGASYIGDEWVYLTPDGAIHGVPEPIRLWHWHVRQLRDIAAGLPMATRARLAGLPRAASLATTIAERLSPKTVGASVLRRAAPVIRRQAYVQIPPAQLFGSEAVVLHGRLDALLLLASHEASAVTVKPIDAAHVGRRMLASLAEERAPFLAHYRQFRFAFPDRRSDVVENAGAMEQELFDRLLAGRTAHIVRHPYPVRLDSLVPPIASALNLPTRAPKKRPGANR